MTVYDRTGLPTPREGWFAGCGCANGCPHCYGVTPDERTWNPAALGLIRKLTPARSYPPPKETPTWESTNDAVNEFYRR